MNGPVCGACGLPMSPTDSRLRPELFLHDACLPDELRPQPMACIARDSEGPKTHEEARFFNEGFKSGLRVYARESGHSTLRSENDLLRRLMDEQGWMAGHLRGDGECLPGRS